jgi:hypothetical protein
MSDEEKGSHPDERRAVVRRPVLLPVRLAILGTSTGERTLSRLSATCYGVVYDISSNGLQLEVTGIVADHFLRSGELSAAVQVGFIHHDLRAKGDLVGRVKWSKAASQRGACILGIRFDAPVPQQRVDEIVGQASRTGTKSTSFWLPVCGAIIVFSAAAAWLYVDDANKRTADASARVEKALDEKGRALDQCRGVLEQTTSTLNTAQARLALQRAATPEPADGGAAVRDAGDGARPHQDAGPDAAASVVRDRRWAD